MRGLSGESARKREVRVETKDERDEVIGVEREKREGRECLNWSPQFWVEIIRDSRADI